mmetsp:Transcript_52749/g.157296  ORF Transcript_52749/g.157296 Transcript_52749/m.157296 type:complete len:230 (-) Transcript_52749:154-843(-)
MGEEGLPRASDRQRRLGRADREAVRALSGHGRRRVPEALRGHGPALRRRRGQRGPLAEGEDSHGLGDDALGGAPQGLRGERPLGAGGQVCGRGRAQASRVDPAARLDGLLGRARRSARGREGRQPGGALPELRRHERRRAREGVRRQAGAALHAAPREEGDARDVAAVDAVAAAARRTSLVGVPRARRAAGRLLPAKADRPRHCGGPRLRGHACGGGAPRAAPAAALHT